MGKAYASNALTSSYKDEVTVYRAIYYGYKDRRRSRAMSSERRKRSNNSVAVVNPVGPSTV